MKKRESEICEEILTRLKKIHIGKFLGMEKPLFLISETYPGVWLEHAYDSVFYATLDRSMLYLAENTAELFLSLQKGKKLIGLTDDKVGMMGAKLLCVAEAPGHTDGLDACRLTRFHIRRGVSDV